jgi:hypothetical protein
MDDDYDIIRFENTVEEFNIIEILSDQLPSVNTLIDFFYNIKFVVLNKVSECTIIIFGTVIKIKRTMLRKYI